MAGRAKWLVEEGRRALRQAGRKWLGAPSWLEGSRATGVVLSLDPPIVSTTLTWPEPTSYLWAFGSRIGKKPAAVIVRFSWHFDGGWASDIGIREVTKYRRRFPMHRIHFLANAPDELESLEKLGERGILLNHNLTVSDRLYFPVAGVPVEFDAIYNARFDRMKRVDLAFGIDRVAYITRSVGFDDPREVARLRGEIAARHPDHMILNPAEGGSLRKLDTEEVNLSLARAAVGLCLSEVEGAMLASMEYMLAGLPIVSTPSQGGRDFFFDPDYCLVVTPDPRSIREAVIALKARAIPRAYIRARTLAKVEAQRRGFLDLLNRILVQLGHPPRFGNAWPWPQRRNFSPWGMVKDHFAEAEAEQAGAAEMPSWRNERSR